MKFTGERVVLDDVSLQSLLAEHLCRYIFAAGLISNGSKVLDAGCGVGYGAAHLANTCAHVIGIDIANDALSFARSRFSDRNVEYKEMDCTCLQFADGFFDSVVSFELIEHLDAEAQIRFVHEVERILGPRGTFVVSTPNREVYRASRDGMPNPFHARELSVSEFRGLLHQVFPSVVLYGQRKTRTYMMYELLHAMNARLARQEFYFRRPLLLFLKMVQATGRQFVPQRVQNLVTSSGVRLDGGADGITTRPEQNCAKLRRLFEHLSSPPTDQRVVRADDFEIVPYEIEQAQYVVAVCHKDG